MKKKIMVIGPSQSGKSQLTQFLEGKEVPSLRKHQDVIYGNCTIDVPTAYIENRWLYRSIIAIAQNQAAVLVMLLNQETPETHFYSPTFASAFTMPVIGVVTHVSRHNEATRRCEQQLKDAGVQPPFYYLPSLEDNRMAWQQLAECLKEKIS